MPRIPAIIPISDLRKDAASVLNRVRKTKSPIFITQRGRASVVLIDIKEYERSLLEMELLRRLARGEREIQEGKGHDIIEVLSEADKILEKES